MSKTQAQLLAEINSNITTNGAGAITGAILNVVLQDMVNATFGDIVGTSLIVNGTSNLTGATTIGATLAIGGATIGTNALAVTGTTLLNAKLSIVPANNQNAVTLGAGTILSTDPSIVSARTVDNTGAGSSVSAHAFADNASVSRSGGIGYCSYDSRVIYTGTQGYDHHVSFQDVGNSQQSGGGTITNWYTLYSKPNVSVGATVTNRYGAYIGEMASVAGTLPNQYGIYIENLALAGTLNYAIYTAGTTPSLFGGQLTNALGTITTSKPLFQTQTWNAAGVIFSAQTINVTPTAFATTSRYLDLQDAGTSLARFELVSGDYAQLVLARSNALPAQTCAINMFAGNLNLQLSTAGAGFTIKAATVVRLTYDTVIGVNSGLTLGSDQPFGWSPSTTANFANDAFWGRAAAGSIQQGGANGTSPVAQTYKVQDALTANNSGASTFTIMASLSVGTGTSGDLLLQTGRNGNGSGVLATATSGLTIKGETQSVVLGSAAIATNSTDGFLYVVSGAGTPTGIPTTFTGRVPIYLDTTNSQLWLYLGGAWKQPKTPAGATLITWQ